MSRQLVAVPVARYEAIRNALARALDGTGPALLPLSDDPDHAHRIRAALRPDQPLGNEAVALVLPTTGTTAQPKGVMLSAAALEASAQATHGRIGGPGQWLLALPLTHIAGIQVVVRSLLSGLPEQRIAPGGAAFAEAFRTQTALLMRRDAATYTALVPTQLARLLAAGPAVRDALASHDAVLIGGAATPPRLLAAARGAGVAVITTYGMSETAGGCVYDGIPLDGVGVRVDEFGRLRVRGPMLFSGYRLRPDLTAAALIDGELITEDLGQVAADGSVRVLGRADDVVQVGGESVSLTAVEATLLEHPGVSQAVVLAVPDQDRGCSLVAVVVPDGCNPSSEELGAWITARLGRAATPRRLLLRDALPLAGPGKVDRRALARGLS